MPAGDDLSLIVLKGHLLLEEVIERVIALGVPHPEFVGQLRLTAFQKAQIARSMCWADHTDEAWQLIEALNTLRNDLAHHLDPPRLETKVKSLLEQFARLYAGASDAATRSSAPVPDQLRSAIALALGFLFSLESDMSAFHEAVTALYQTGKSSRSPEDVGGT
jgi:hypothetical protein